MLKKNDSPFFSIVMPIYNVENFLPRSLGCLEAQTFDNWELLAVDDCSTDGSLRVLEKYKISDKRIRVIRHEKNLGVSEARNTGLSMAKGSYVWFADPDDKYEPDLLKRVQEVLVLSAMVPVVMFGHYEEWYKANGSFSHQVPVCEPCSIELSSKDIHNAALHFEETTAYGYPWNKVYSLDYLKKHDLYFKNVSYIEDIDFNIRVFQELDRLVIVKDALYHYAKRPSISLTGKYDKDFFNLHVSRVRLLYNQLLSWDDVEDLDNKFSILGKLLCRYVVAALRMNCYPDANMTYRKRLSWCRGLYENDFIKHMISVADEPRDCIVKTCIYALKHRHTRFLLLIGRAAYEVEAHMYPLLSKLK